MSDVRPFDYRSILIELAEMLGDANSDDVQWTRTRDKLVTEALASADALDQTISMDEIEAAIRGCGSLDSNGYICEKSAAIKAVRDLSVTP